MISTGRRNTLMIALKMERAMAKRTSDSPSNAPIVGGRKTVCLILCFSLAICTRLRNSFDENGDNYR